MQFCPRLFLASNSQSVKDLLHRELGLPQFSTTLVPLNGHRHHQPACPSCSLEGPPQPAPCSPRLGPCLTRQLSTLWHLAGFTPYKWRSFKPFLPLIESFSSCPAHGQHLAASNPLMLACNSIYNSPSPCRGRPCNWRAPLISCTPVQLHLVAPPSRNLAALGPALSFYRSSGIPSRPRAMLLPPELQWTTFFSLPSMEPSLLTRLLGARSPCP
ncbi:hypothetical protein GOP47_0020299, partial [Adiantum capillus-veneris]